MTRRTRHEELALRLARADARLRARERAHSRDIDGTATLAEYQLLYREVIAEWLLRVVPTLIVVRAARRARVAPAPTRRAGGRLIITVLSYRPHEKLPEGLVDQVQQLQDRAVGTDGDPLDRAVTAIKYLLLGSTDGLARRREIWNAGLPEAEAAHTCLDLNAPHHRELLHSWELLEQDIQRQVVEQGGSWRDEDAWWSGLPLDAIAGALDEGMWTGHERPEPATDGQVGTPQQAL